MAQLLGAIAPGNTYLVFILEARIRDQNAKHVN